MKDFFFYRVHPDEITKDQIKLLELSTESDVTGIPASEILDEIRCGESQLWAFQTMDKDGIMVTRVMKTEVSEFVSITELFIFRMIGSGFYHRFEELEAMLIDFAKSQDATRITANVVPWLGAKIVQNYNYTMDALLIRKEI